MPSKYRNDDGRRPRTTRWRDNVSLRTAEWARDQSRLLRVPGLFDEPQFRFVDCEGDRLLPDQ